MGLPDQVSGDALADRRSSIITTPTPKGGIMERETDLSRRSFLKLGAAAGATAAAAAVAFPRFSLANVKTVSLSQCTRMTPEAMAENSRMVMDSLAYLKNVVATISDPEIRGGVEGIMRNPAPTLMADLMDEQNRKAVYTELQSRGLVAEDLAFADFLPPTENPYRSPHPFIAGPGSGYGSHHAYPGGLITHTAVNTMVSLSLFDHYREVYGFRLDRDVVIASQVLHDLHKPWVFQWHPKTGESRTERKLAGTGEHHSYGVAESIVRGLPAEVCVAQACAHNHPGWAKDEEGPVNWIKAACTLIGKDPVAAGLLGPDSKTLPLPRRMENFVCHLGDHDWILSVPAAKWTIPLMADIAKNRYGMSEADLMTRRFNALRNYVFSQASIMGLYEIYATRGKDALAHTVLSMVTPA
jgi:hypothetical protein